MENTWRVKKEIEAQFNRPPLTNQLGNMSSSSTVKHARKGSVYIHSEVQHTNYLLHQKYSEFTNCLSEEHLISDHFAVIGTQ